MSLFTVLATSKLAAGVLAAGVITVGGTGVAAYAGALPSEVQRTAHDLIGAPVSVAAIEIAPGAPSPSLPSPAPSLSVTETPAPTTTLLNSVVPVPAGPDRAEKGKSEAVGSGQKGVEGQSGDSGQTGGLEQSGELKPSGLHEHSPDGSKEDAPVPSNMAPAVPVTPKAPADRNSQGGGQLDSNGSESSDNND